MSCLIVSLSPSLSTLVFSKLFRPRGLSTGLGTFLRRRTNTFPSAQQTPQLNHHFSGLLPNFWHQLYSLLESLSLSTHSPDTVCNYTSVLTCLMTVHSIHIHSGATSYPIPVTHAYGRFMGSVTGSRTDRFDGFANCVCFTNLPVEKSLVGLWRRNSVSTDITQTFQ